MVTSRDSCIYKKGDDDDRRFCFISSGTHQTECLAVDDSESDSTGSSEGFSTTEEPNELPSAGAFTDEHVEFKEIYLNVSSEPLTLPRHTCNLQSVLTEMRRSSPRTFAAINTNKQWKGAKVRWNFISDNENPLGKFSKMKDDKLGLSESDVKTLMAAMKQIEADTCVRFVRDKEVTDQEDWLLVMREYKNNKCHKDYINNLVKQGGEQNIKWFKNVEGKSCFSGAYAFLGAGQPNQLVIGQANLDPEKQSDIGLIAHELLHTLGFGHTQKREDAGDYITINWENISKDGHDQYKPCSKEDGNKGKICPDYKTYGLPYDCESIMHYEDYQFQIEGKGKTMVSKDPKTCDISKDKIRLSEGDKEIINLMYCKDEIKKYEVASPDFPKQYPPNIGKDKPHVQKISVAEGFAVELTFSVFNIEGKAGTGDSEDPADMKCWDWVQIFEGDDTELTEKMCGYALPKKVRSKTNVMLIKFHSDATNNYDGFLARWKRVRKTKITNQSKSFLGKA